MEVLPATTAPGPTGFTVSIADVASTADAFGRAHTAAAQAVTTASEQLATTTAMAGDDPVLAAWRTRYHAVADATWTATSAATRTLHDTAAKLVDTGNAYLAADHASTPNRTGRPDRLPAPGPPAAPPTGPPSATGPTGEEVPSEYAEYWPGGDPTRLRHAASAWTALASAHTHTAQDADRAFRALATHNTGPGFSAMAAFWSSRYAPCALDPLFCAAPNGAQLLGQTCADLADLIDTTRARLRNAAADAEQTVLPLRVVGMAKGLVGSAAEALEFLAGPLVEWRYLEDDRQAYLERLDELTARLSVHEEERLDRAARFPTATDPPGLTITDVGEVTGLGLRGSGWDHLGGDRPTPDSVVLTSEKRGHILDGDARGGGHRYGTGRRDKSEFPQSWRPDNRIIEAVLSVARDPDPALGATLQGNNRWKVHGTRNGVIIEVILERDGSIVTAYPLSGPGVHRNPP